MGESSSWGLWIVRAGLFGSKVVGFLVSRRALVVPLFVGRRVEGGSGSLSECCEWGPSPTAQLYFSILVQVQIF